MQTFTLKPHSHDLPREMRWKANEPLQKLFCEKVWNLLKKLKKRSHNVRTYVNTYLTYVGSHLKLLK